MENCLGGKDDNDDNDDRGAEVVGGGNGDDDDNENDYNLAQVTGVMRRHGVDCASLARGVKVVNIKIFLLQWKFYLNLPVKVVTSNRNPSHCTHSSHRYSETQDNKLIDSLKLTGSLIYTLVCPKYFCNWVNWVYIHNQFQPRCHHAAHAYTGVPCSKHKRRRSRRDPRDPRDGVLPRLPGGAGNTAKSGRMRSFNPKAVLKHVNVKS